MLSAKAIHHSDQGVQYTRKVYQQYLQAAGLIASMSRKAIPYDNVMMASYFSPLKHELTHLERFADRADARSKVVEYSSSTGSVCTADWTTNPLSSSRRWRALPNATVRKIGIHPGLLPYSGE